MLARQAVAIMKADFNPTLLSRDDILGAYQSPGRHTLQLLTPSLENADRPERTADPIESEDGGGAGRTSDDRATGPGIAKRLRHVASHDALTGLSNRHHFQSRFKKALSRARRDGGKLAFAVLDLDDFKDVNNTAGHQAGDAILVETGRNLQSVLHSNDIVGRFGGDEFALVLASVPSEADIEPITVRLLDSAAASVSRFAPQIRSSASLGVSLFPDHGVEANELIENAEIALYRAKAQGRGRAQVFQPQMRQALTDRIQRMSTFRTLLETGGVKPFYQPQIRLSDRRAHGFEALARWIMPNGEILYPSYFQAALEDPEAAILLGEHMLKSISDDLRHWRDVGMSSCKVSINVTAPELGRGDYPEKVAELFASKGVPLSHLTVEITESVLLDDKVALLIQTLSDLRRLGVSIALDDFGTGFATLTHLRKHPIDQIKIDRSFIANLTTNADDHAIVISMLRLAHSLSMEAIAEGVETEEQLRYLRSLGCEYGQGFLFSKAIPALEAEAYFREHRAYRRAEFPRFEVTSRK